MLTAPAPAGNRAQRPARKVCECGLAPRRPGDVASNNHVKLKFMFKRGFGNVRPRSFCRRTNPHRPCSSAAMLSAEITAVKLPKFLRNDVTPAPNRIRPRTLETSRKVTLFPSLPDELGL